MQPSPFVIQHLPDGAIVASDGGMTVIMPDAHASAKMLLRRGVRGLPGGPVAEKIIPQLNLLAGDLLSNSSMPAAEVKARLHILMAACEEPEPENLECCVAEQNGMRVYVQQGRVIFTSQDIAV